MKHLATLLLALILVACTNQDSTTASKHSDEKKVKVTVILPLDSASGAHWKRTANWFNENLEEAFNHLSIDSSFTFEIEWIDENKTNMDSLGDALTKRKDLAAIIGPMHSLKLDTIAQYMQSCNKNGNRISLIAPTASADEIVRKYIEEKWFFALTDTDISQSQILLNQVIASGAKSVSLLISSSEEQKTFLDWFTFLATEFNLEIKNLYIYYKPSELASKAEQAFSQSNDFIVCFPESHKDIPDILKAYKKHGKKTPLLFGNTAHDINILSYSDIEGIEGISIGSNPENGFDIAYGAKFSEIPVTGEAQVYDALLLTAFAQMYVWSDYSRFIDASLSKAIEKDSTASEIIAWESIPMSRIMKKILGGESFNIGGASGNFCFKSKSEPIVDQTYYTHWKILNKKFVQQEYLSVDGSRRTISTAASYNWINGVFRDPFIADSSAEQIEYIPLKGNYALLIATSESWLNYRHQADILSIYKRLKSFGMDDDHIVLIIEDNLAESPSNPAPGTLIDFDGNSIYDNVKVDYKTSDLLPEDLLSILTGKKSERLHTVIESDSSQNIFVFWSGHGLPSSLTWPKNEQNENFTQEHMADIIKQMSKEKKYRKMLWMFETCYSGNICAAFTQQGQQGTLCFAAATGSETSKAIEFNSDYKVYMTNSFTKNFMHELDLINPDVVSSDVSLSDLYFYTVKNTLGSHVTIYNQDKYGNLLFSGLREFLIKL